MHSYIRCIFSDPCFLPSWEYCFPSSGNWIVAAVPLLCASERRGVVCNILTRRGCYSVRVLSQRLCRSKASPSFWAFKSLFGLCCFLVKERDTPPHCCPLFFQERIPTSRKKMGLESQSVIFWDEN